jgi:signal transduction histidine kinase
VSAAAKLLDGLPAKSVERACTLLVRAVAYDYLHQPDLAVGDALVAYRIAEEGGWPNAKIEAAGTLARAFSGAGLSVQAEQMIDVVITMAKADGKTSLLSTAEYERGKLLVKARRFADARIALEQSIAYANKIGDRFGVAAAFATLCWAVLREGDLDAADRLCQGGDAELAQAHREDLAIQLIGNRARLDLERHRPAQALAKLDSILKPGIHAMLPGSEPQFYWDRARALRMLRRIPEANADLVRLHEVEEAADAEQRNRQVAVMSAVIASENLEAANHQLEERVTLQQAEVKRQHEQRNILTGATLVISSLLGYLLWVSQRHGRALRNRDIILRSAGLNAPDAFLVLDGQRRVRFANRNLCGRGPVPSVGDSVISALPDRLVPALTTAIDEAFVKRTVIWFEAELADLPGVPRQFEMCVVPAVEKDRVVGGTLRSIDVTDQRELERRVVDGATHERQRLSSELHEGVGQQLAGVLLLVGSAAKIVRRELPNAAALLDEIGRHVAEGIAATRELARGLAPVKIGMGSLAVALDSLVTDAGRRLRIEARCDCKLEGVVLSDLAADHLYGICREAVTNAALHGRCSTVQIDVRVEGAVLRLSVCDDGKGMPPGGPHRHGLGVKMMAYRTRLLGGECEITGRAEGGTCVVATVPLAHVVAQPLQREVV